MVNVSIVYTPGGYCHATFLSINNSFFSALQEEHQPSSIFCKVPRLIAIKGRCCKEWVCPNSNSLPDNDDDIYQPNDVSDKGKGKLYLNIFCFISHEKRFDDITVH